MTLRFLKRAPRCNHPINHTLSIRHYGIMELESKFGANFKKIQELDLEKANALEKKMHVFINRIQKSSTLNDTITVHDGEKVPIEGDGENIPKPNMQKIIQASYNWNPYHGRTTKKNEKMQHDHLDAIPDEYKQAGWGMQTAPITGSTHIHKMFPNTDILKNMMQDGQRVFEMGHLLTNPLREMGYRDANIAEGRDYNVVERVLEPFASNIVEEWHGSQAIESQKQTEPIDTEDDMNLSQRQLIMRRLKQRAEKAYKDNDSLPPYKYGFEDIPVFITQTNYHSPDKLGDAKRTRELKATACVYLKYIFPNMTRAQRTACTLIGGKQYNPKTTALNLYCTNHYFNSENEKQIMDWIGRLILEIERFAEYLSNSDAPDEITWEEYKDRYADEWNKDVIRRKWNKYRWKQKMLSLPEHLRGNYNLYQNGRRMNKLARYLDVSYDKAFVDAGNILQREGPKKGTATEYYEGYLPSMEEIVGTEIDALPDQPSDYMIQKEENEKEKKEMIGRFNIVTDYPKNKRHTFGVNSCYLIPPSDKQFEDVENAFHMPLAQPFSGLRLRKHKLTPWTNSSMMKLYRNERSRVGMKLVFGDEQFKAAMVKKTQEIEGEKAKQKMKQQQQALKMGRKRSRKKNMELQRKMEERELKMKHRLQKKNNEAEDNPLFMYLGSKKIAKQFQSSVTDISV
eukprot:102847_1